MLIKLMKRNMGGSPIGLGIAEGRGGWVGVRLFQLMMLLAASDEEHQDASSALTAWSASI